jgi:hypothetical protein
MADLPKLERPKRRIAQPGELDGISMLGRSMGQAGARYNPDAMTVTAPLIDARGFVDEARGMAQVGQAAREIGGATMRLAVEQARAVADRQVRDARRALGTVQTEMGAALASEPDEQKYGEILETQLERARAVVRDTPMMADAKLAADDYLAEWETQQRHNVTMMQARRSFDRARESRMADVTEAVNRNDFAAARAAISDDQAGLYLGKDRVAGLMGDIDRAEKNHMIRARREAVEADASAAPYLWMERHPEPGDMEPDDWFAGQSAARRVIAAQTDAAASDIGDAMVTGDIKTSDDVERVAAGRLRPAALAEAQANLKKWQSDAWRGENLSEAGVTKNFGLLLDEVDKYDKSKDPDGARYAGLVMKAKALMPEGLRDDVLRPLTRKWDPGSAPEAPEPMSAFVRETFRNWFDDGKFGRTQKEVPLQPTDDGWYPGTTRKKLIDDPPARDAAAARRAQAQITMSEWLKANPNASIKEVKNQLLQSSSASLLPSDVNTLLRRPGPAAPAADPAARIKEIGDKFGVLKEGGFKARATGYFPVDPGDPNYEMQGGRFGASEWHGEPVTPEPLYTLDDYYDGNAPYVSVAMDNSKNNPLGYGTKLESPQFPGVPFRVMDTGSAFNGKTKKYGPAKGLGRIDIARRDRKGAWSSVNNRAIEFIVANDADSQKPPFDS